MIKPKIAVCISGQIRNYNSHGHQIINAIKYLFDEDKFDIDFYGHTWTDQEKPKNLSMFKGFVHEDQDNIWEFAKPNLHEYIPYRKSWWYQKEYKDILNNNGNLADFYKDMLKGGLAQIWSHHQCVRQINDLFNYKAVIRCRWDGILNDLDYWDNTDTNELKYAKDIIYKFISKSKPESLEHHDINALCVHAFLKHNGPGPFIDDHFFVFEPVKKMMHSVEDILKNMARIGTQDTFPVSHQGWVTYLRATDINVAGLLPKIMQYNGENVGIKPNKKWSI